MSAGKLCMIFEAIGPFSAIAKIAMAEVEAALSAGWEVSVVAKFLDESLHGRVEWLRLYVPPRGFALQWLTARWFIGRAIGDRSRFDVIHGHQPQIADWCDVFQCHFLTRAAFRKQCLFDGRGLRRVLDVGQKLLVLAAEDRHFKNWNPATKMIFVSELLAQEFGRLYRTPPNAEVIENAGPDIDLVSSDERGAARARLVPTAGDRLVVGFLGGKIERKGYNELVTAIAAAGDGVFLLFGGPNSQYFEDARLGGRVKGVGTVRDVRQFLAACDVVAVTSVFDPCPVVLLEAASRGIPTVVTNGVGNANSAISHGAAELWDVRADLTPILKRLAERDEPSKERALRWSTEKSLSAYCHQMLHQYDCVRMSRRLKVDKGS